MKILMIRFGDLSKSNNVVNLANYFSNAGNEVALASIEGGASPPALLSQKIKYHGLLFREKTGTKIVHKIARLRNIPRLVSVVRSGGWDIIYVVDSWTLWMAALVSIICRRHLKKCVFVYHTFDWLEPNLHRKIHIFIEKAACKKADIVVNADRSRARMQRTIYNLAQTPMWIPNYPSLSCLKGSAAQTEHPGLNKNPDEISIVYPTVASDASSEARQLHNLISAFEYLPDNYKLVTFYQDGIYFRRCKQQVNGKNLGTRISFLPPMPYEKLLAHVAISDMGIAFYDDSKSSGYYMCNADKLNLFLISGIPVVASDFPGLESLIYKHRLGVTCDSHEPKDIAAAIQEVAEDNDWRSHITKSLENELNLEKHGDRLLYAMAHIAKVKRS
ncbi:MAG: glycosyltransferase [Nitrospirota bacterium]